MRSSFTRRKSRHNAPLSTRPDPGKALKCWRLQRETLEPVRYSEVLWTSFASPTFSCRCQHEVLRPVSRPYGRYRVVTVQKQLWTPKAARNWMPCRNTQPLSPRQISNSAEGVQTLKHQERRRSPIWRASWHPSKTPTRHSHVNI